FLTLCYLPFTYMMRMVALQGYKVLTEDYILTAKSKGLKKWTIYARHVLRNVLPVIKADLFRIASIMTGNLIVIENLFNSPGITRFLIPSLDWNLELKDSGNVLLYFVIHPKKCISSFRSLRISRNVVGKPTNTISLILLPSTFFSP
ncbi:ABC transporter permease subunit, partial [Thermoactinomyces sp. CICC 10522]|uniref:ABC transporter permease subunit n=1 Tax=Thermoactinomyces sp. CICC 10522 TaxID=2767427 RepID=UPI0018DE9770